MNPYRFASPGSCSCFTLHQSCHLLKDRDTVPCIACSHARLDVQIAVPWPVMLPRESLETIPIEVGIGLYSWTIICQGDQRMRLQRNRMKIPCIRLPIDVGLPAICEIQLIGIAQLRELRSPDVQKVLEGGGNAIWGLDMDHPVSRVRVEPIEARWSGWIACNPDIGRDGDALPIDVDRDVRMNVKGALFQLITGNSVYGGIGRVRRCLALGNNEVGDASDSQHDGSNDADDGYAPCANGTPPLYFTPLQFLLASSLPGALTRTLLTHGSVSPFHKHVKIACAITEERADHHRSLDRDRFPAAPEASGPPQPFVEQPPQG